MDKQKLLREAGHPGSTPFDYIIVGSGAGGGPLAARLAENGRRVLLLDAGVDPATTPNGKMREVYSVPAYHGAATEDEATSWAFSVRHFANSAQQKKDTKYDERHDPSARGGGQRKGGILYPRCAALGGCTAHHAMIIIRPDDSDWDRIAERTGDESWRSENMQGYFPKIERCLYYSVYRSFIGKLFGGLLRAVQSVATFISPMRQLDPGGHGFHGWQPTSFINPLVIASIARTDRTFLRVLFDVVWSALAGDRGILKRALTQWQLIQFLDPNVRSPVFPDRAHLSLISIGTNGRERVAVRERVRDVENKYPDRLVIVNEVHVTRVIFEAQPNQAPRAVGVELRAGAHLYGASPLRRDAASAEMRQYFAKSEVILCGGAFNTPQLLMLSGIGDRNELAAQRIEGPRDADGRKVAEIVDLPGVGKNLQDRYEVSVISQVKKPFSTLDGVSFVPGDANDPARKQWLAGEMGLYSTNGGALAMMHRLSVTEPGKQPDVFIFGAPAAFRGYYWDWSKELLRREKGAPADERDLWSWIILKAYTKNNLGTVRLVSRDPFEPPEINFNSFTGPGNGPQNDIACLREAVKRVRAMNARITPFVGEIQPGKAVQGDAAIEEWVQNEAWGHHACGTCRMGADRWAEEPGRLEDKGAVLDSQFRVHGVRGLRVVDASVFPEIPGYFIVTPIFMISEKAADALLASAAEYPNALRDVEAAAVRDRRNVAEVAMPANTPAGHLPADTVALALSGGGVRSATFSLGLLQALASRRQLRGIDFISGVSGGGYAAAFLGRLFTRMGAAVDDKVGRVQDILTAPQSAELWWLRRNANYLTGAGRADLISSIAVVTRNIVALYFSIAALLFAVFGALRWSQETWPAFNWWGIPAVMAALVLLPLGFAFSLAPPTDARKAYLWPPVAVWCVLLAAALTALGYPAARPWAAGALAVLVLAWIYQEAARWRIGAGDSPAGAAEVRVRNRLTNWLGKMLAWTLGALALVVLDVLARHAAVHIGRAGFGMLATAMLLPLIRMLAMYVAGKKREHAPKADGFARALRLLSGLSFVITALLFFFADVVVHGAFNYDLEFGIWLTLSALAVSVAIGQAFRFLNSSSLQPLYAARLVRTYLGASNDERVHPAGTDAPLRVDLPSAADDVAFDAYHPERNGAPLHLIGTCVNETVDALTGRQLRQDNGLPMCVGPAGISVGRRFHALWQSAGAQDARVAITPLAAAPDPNQFHVLARSDARQVAIERLRLGQWMAISGAAFSTGVGRGTSLAHSLLFGLLNIRLGYWWDTGIDAGARPGRFPPGLWRRIASLPAMIFRVQATLLNEWRGYFTGPCDRFWYVSDGGHFDNTGLYELLRRRVALILAVDGGEDSDYVLDDQAILVRQARLDFGAEFEWLDPTAERAAGATGWKAVDPSNRVPAWVQQRFDADAIGAPSALKRDNPAVATMARITYANDPAAETWLVVIKPAVMTAVPLDVRNYAGRHAAFPNEPTLNQFFDDDQWESYRMLGWCAGQRLLAGPAPAHVMSASAALRSSRLRPGRALG